MKTKSMKASEINRRWWVVDANGKVLGRIATEIARVLRGKHKPQYTPHADTGDFVIVTNAEKVKLTGKKETDKIYHHHTGWVGGIVSQSVEDVRAAHPERLVENAVYGMMPRGPLGREMYKKLRVYSGTDHPHEAQKPEPMAI